MIVESDLVTSNIPGDRRDDSDTSGSMQRRNSTEVLEWSRPIELDSSACTNRTQKPAYCRVQQLHTPKLTGQVISRAYPTLSLFQQSTISAAPSIYSLLLAPGAQPLMVCSVNCRSYFPERARNGFPRNMGCISNETISPTLWRPLQDDLVTSKGTWATRTNSPGAGYQTAAFAGVLTIQAMVSPQLGMTNRPITLICLPQSRKDGPNGPPGLGKSFQAVELVVPLSHWRCQRSVSTRAFRCGERSAIPVTSQVQAK